MIRYKDFIIKFHEGEQVTLNYKSDTDGLVKYETSFINPSCLKEGEYVKLTLIVEHTLIDEKIKPYK